MLRLKSGLEMAEPLDVLERFCEEEYAYYDAIPSDDPDRIAPVDVLATVAMNSFVNNAAAVRRVHRGMAEACDAALASIPVDADLRSFDLDPLRDLLDRACRVRGVLVAVATKVLHRKRRAYIPMLDSVVIAYYRGTDVAVSGAALADGARAAAAVMPAVDAFRSDLIAAWGELTELVGSLGDGGFEVTQLRALELLLWVGTEPAGYYRNETGSGFRG